jgi:hypothetical protein
LHSVRSGSGIPFEESVTYSFPIQGLFGLLSPFYLPHNADRFTGEKFFWIWSGWWGLVATGVAILGLFFAFKKKGISQLPIYKKLILLALVLILVGLGWSMGDASPWFKPIYFLFFPIRLFRYPPVALYYVLIGVSILVLLGSSLLKRYPVILVLLLCLLTLELWVYSRHLHPTVISDYFKMTFPIIWHVQKEKPGMVFLSPKLDRNRHLPGMDSFEAVLKFRGFLFDLTNLPYRIPSLVVSGEPLTLKTYDHFFNEIMQKKDFKNARKLLNFWNVTHFLTQDTLDSSWNLIFSEDHLKLYKNSEALGSVFALPAPPIEKDEEETFSSSPSPWVGTPIITPIKSKFSNTQIMAHFQLTEPAQVIFNKPFYPGWELYSRQTGKLPTFQVHHYFTAAKLPSGEQTLFLHYSPWTWKLGLGIFLISFLFFGFLGLETFKPLGRDSFFSFRTVKNFLIK